MRQVVTAAAAAALMAMLAGAAGADCAREEAIARFAKDYLAKQPTEALGAGGSMVDALCTQGRLAEVLSAEFGPVIGYKAGLTSAPAQERFGATEPVRGVLYRDMMRESGVTLDAYWGAVPMVEADLVLEIRDSAVNAATTPAEVMQYVSAVYPFIELPDLALAEGQPMTPETITAMGVGARLGVLGAAIPVEDAEAMATMLGVMQVELRDGTGAVVAQAPGAAVLGHPAESVMWLHDAGVTFKAGDLVSVGSFGPLVPAAKMQGGATVSYSGLPGNPEVSVQFAPGS